VTCDSISPVTCEIGVQHVILLLKRASSSTPPYGRFLEPRESKLTVDIYFYAESFIISYASCLGLSAVNLAQFTIEVGVALSEPKITIKSLKTVFLNFNVVQGR